MYTHDKSKNGDIVHRLVMSTPSRQDRRFCIRQWRRWNSQDQYLWLLWWRQRSWNFWFTVRNWWRSGLQRNTSTIQFSSESTVYHPVESCMDICLLILNCRYSNLVLDSTSSKILKLLSSPSTEMQFLFLSRVLKGRKLFGAGSAAEVVGFNPELRLEHSSCDEPIVRIRVILFQFGTLFGFGGASNPEQLSCNLLSVCSFWYCRHRSRTRIWGHRIWDSQWSECWKTHLCTCWI